MMLNRRQGFTRWAANHSAVVPRGGCRDQLPLLSSDRDPLDLLGGRKNPWG
jgi:hypothetical protein